MTAAMMCFIFSLLILNWGHFNFLQVIAATWNVICVSESGLLCAWGDSSGHYRLLLFKYASFFCIEFLFQYCDTHPVSLNYLRWILCFQFSVKKSKKLYMTFFEMVLKFPFSTCRQYRSQIKSINSLKSSRINDVQMLSGHCYLIKMWLSKS